MIRYVVSRVTFSLVVLLLLSAVIFIAGRGLVSGSVATMIAGPRASQEAIAALESDLGFDRPLIVQYGEWLGSALRGDLGESPFSGLRTTEVLAQQIPVSVELALLSVTVAVILGVPAGVLAARRAGSVADVALRIPMIVLFAIPGFITGTLAILVATSVLPNLYSPTYIRFSASAAGNLQTMLLPAIAVGLPTAPLIMQITRASMIDVLSQPFVAAARTNGLTESRVVYGYGLRAALPPILTFIGYTFGMLLGGLLIVEQIFSLPGLGRGLLQSIATRDFVQLNAQALVLAALFILANLVMDLIVPVLDRRIARI